MFTSAAVPFCWSPIVNIVIILTVNELASIILSHKFMENYTTLLKHTKMQKLSSLCKNDFQKNLIPKLDDLYARLAIFTLLFLRPWRGSNIPQPSKIRQQNYLMSLEKSMSANTCGDSPSFCHLIL